MAVPKKKSSRSRTGMRRYSTAYKMDPISGTTCAFTHEPVRTHTVSMKSIKEGLYNAADAKKLAAKKAKPAAKKSASANA